MKNFRIIFTILLFSFMFCYVKAQTKQETMDFIAGKIQKYLVSPREFVSYSNGVFKYNKRNIEGTKEVDKTKRVQNGNYIINGIAIPKYETQKYTEEVDFNCGSIVYTIDLNNVTKLSFYDSSSSVLKVNNYDRDGNFTGVVDKVFYGGSDFSIIGKKILTRDYSQYKCKDTDDTNFDDSFNFLDRDAIDFYTEEGLPTRMKKAFELLVKYNQKTSDGGLFMD